jgi:hypothetical protein
MSSRSILPALALGIALAAAACGSPSPSVAPASAGPGIASSPAVTPSTAAEGPTAGASSPAGSGTSAAALECTAPASPTTSQTEGPYYTPGAPERADLVDEGMAGTILQLSGFVVDTDCTPLANAKVDVWQADAATGCAGTCAPTRTADGRSGQWCPASTRGAPSTFT